MRYYLRNKTNLRKSETSTVKDAIQELLNTYNIKDKYNATRIASSWGGLMGAPIANRTENVFLKEKKMFVKLTSAPLKHELQISKSKVLDIFNREFGSGAVEDIVFL